MAKSKQTVDSESFVCINCGQGAPNLYHDYKGGIIKIAHCKTCGQVVDKYIEYDLVIICLDALLLKRQAGRHILINSHIKSAWKFGMVLLVCEAFTRLVRQRSEDSGKAWLPDPIIYSALEVDLYWNFFLALLDLTCFVSGVLLWLTAWRTVMKPNSWPSLTTFVTGLILSNIGKILVVPVVLWAHKYSVLYLWLGNIFTFAANIQATRVLCPDWPMAMLVAAIVFGHSLAFAATFWIPAHFTAIT